MRQFWSPKGFYGSVVKFFVCFAVVIYLTFAFERKYDHSQERIERSLNQLRPSVLWASEFKVSIARNATRGKSQ